MAESGDDKQAERRARAERLAAALKANLRRRKAQARARAEAGPPEAPSLASQAPSAKNQPD